MTSTHRAIIAALLLSATAADAQESLTVSGALREQTDTYLTAIAEKLWTSRQAGIATLKTPADLDRRQRYIRERFLAGIGGLPERTPLNAKITAAFDREGYRVEKLIYESLPRFYVTANVYVPTQAKPPFPAVLGVAGHSVNGKASALYQRGWIGLAKRGFLVLAFDPPGQGERSEYFDADLGRTALSPTGEHMMAGLQCLLTGTNIARYEIWDGIRAFDYLTTRPDVDPKRIAVAGNSGGGTQSAYLAVAEPRLAAAAPSCYITSWEKLWVKPGPQDSEQVFNRFLADGLDFPDFLIAFAPRPIQALTAIRDYFPIDGARATYQQAQRVFAIAGAGDRAGFFEFDDTHGWSKPRREATYRWMERWLHGRSDEGVEPEFDTEPDHLLQATPTGQIATSLSGETVHSLNAALATRMHGARAGRDAAPAKILELVAARTGFRRLSGPVQATTHGSVGREGYRIDKLLLDSEPGIRVPALAFIPASATRPLPAVLYLHRAGKSADASPGGDIEALVRMGHLVLAVDPRGWGESGVPAARGTEYGPTYQTAMRALLVGKTVTGMQITDVLRAFDYLAARPDIDATRIAVIGKEHGGVLALYAAALEPRIARAAAERSLVSYMSLARARRHEGMVDLVVPGVLADFDLPDLARAISPRKLWIVDPRTPTGARYPSAEVAREYGAAATIAERAEGWSFTKTYAGWR